MTYYLFMQDRLEKKIVQAKYIFTYILLITPVLLTVSFIKNAMPLAFHLLCYFIGWLTWTFTEYMLHRFWHHGDHNHESHFVKSHHEHHTHPGEIKISGLHRLLLVVVCIGMLIISVVLNSFFSIFAGFVIGICGYTFMHWLLHRNWSASLFPRLHQFHIYHHCKYPNLCHGISVPWWDILFKTTPPTGKQISQKVKQFYYGK
jgi:hypothetical protein